MPFYRSSSVGFNGNKTRSNTQTPERDIRASSQNPGGDSNRRPSFSYLSLLDKNGGFPHRTQPIGDPQTSRRNSILGSQEHLNNFVKPNLMVRSNPIGLAEPTNKRDGYAVGKDGTFFRYRYKFCYWCMQRGNFKLFERNLIKQRRLYWKNKPEREFRSEPSQPTYFDFKTLNSVLFR